MVMTYICKTTRKTKAVKRTVSTPFFAGLCAHLAILPPASRVPDMCWYDCEEQDRVASKVFLNTFL